MRRGGVVECVVVGGAVECVLAGGGGGVVVVVVVTTAWEDCDEDGFVAVVAVWCAACLCDFA